MSFFKYYSEFIDEYNESGLISSIKKHTKEISVIVLFGKIGV